MSVANQPYVKLLTLIQAQTALLAVIGDRYGQGNGRDMAGFPAFTWNRLIKGQGSTDIESHLYCRDRVQFDLFGSDADQLHDLALLVDGMNDHPTRSTSLDSTDWVCKVLRRDTAWREVLWRDERHTQTGNPLIQLTSDWRFEYARKQ